MYRPGRSESKTATPRSSLSIRRRESVLDESSSSIVTPSTGCESASGAEARMVMRPTRCLPSGIPSLTRSGPQVLGGQLSARESSETAGRAGKGSACGLEAQPQHSACAVKPIAKRRARPSWVRVASVWERERIMRSMVGWQLPNARVQLRGAFFSKLVNLILNYLTLGHNLMPFAPVCCNT